MSPRSPEQNEEIRHARRRQILHAAIEVYLDNGVRGAEIGEIAERAGVARGLVYHYYKDKMALFEDLFRESLADAKQFVASALDTTDPPMVRLERYLRMYMDSAIEHPHMVRFHKNLQNDIALVFEDRSDEVFQFCEEHLMMPLARTLQEAMEAGSVREMEPLIVMNVFWGSIIGAMNVFLRHPKWQDTEKRKQEVITLVFQGIQRNPGEKGDKHS